MKTDKDFGKRMRAACIETGKAMRELAILLSKINKKHYPTRKKYHN